MSTRKSSAFSCSRWTWIWPEWQAGRHTTSKIVGDYFGHTDLSGFDIADRYRLEKITCSFRVPNGSAETIYRTTPGQFWRWQKLRSPAWYSIGSQGRSSSTLLPGASGSAFQLTTGAGCTQLPTCAELCPVKSFGIVSTNTVSTAVIRQQSI